ncbi:DUF4123 domain-containing protein [Afifella sp. YEN Y35]|uniref:DUF4123 domain-containing protein n=1 Tax=Afifella sp. YEN Y35 TaxID=3388337 RepID=UPI0039E132D6
MEETPNLDLPRSSDAARTIRALLGAAGSPIFAVLDGGQFDDLPGLLGEEDIECRSLFREGGDADHRLAGPWLVPASDVLTQSYVERLDAKAPCAVYWLCPAGEDRLWRHLRTLNEVLIPREESAHQGKATAGAGYERVLFRHWDPNVLAPVLPILTRPQFSRFLGPARRVVFNAPDYGGVKRVGAADDLPPAPPGPLRFEPEQMDRLKVAMLHASRLRIARFLKGHVPPHFSGVNDDFVWGATLASEKSADELGIRTERGRARWATVMVVSDGKAAEMPEVRDYVRGGNPDERVKSLIGHAVDALRSGAAAAS